MNVEQFRAMVVGDRILEQEREQAEHRSRFAGRRPGPAGSLLDYLIDLLR
jgi:hypothetical protein